MFYVLLEFNEIWIGLLTLVYCNNQYFMDNILFSVGVFSVVKETFGSFDIFYSKNFSNSSKISKSNLIF